MKTQIYKVRDINEYWERLDKDLEISIIHMLRDRYEYDRRKQYSFETTYCPIPEDVRLNMQNNVKEALDWGGTEALYSYVL